MATRRSRGERRLAFAAAAAAAPQQWHAGAAQRTRTFLRTRSHSSRPPPPHLRSRVADLFQSVQLNVNNPHFLIMQGRVTKARPRARGAPCAAAPAAPGSSGSAVSSRMWLWPLLPWCLPVQRPASPPPPLPAPLQIMNMRPPEILSLLEEASGTKLYERKKEGALRTLSKKQTKLDEIDQVRPHRATVQELTTCQLPVSQAPPRWRSPAMRSCGRSRGACHHSGDVLRVHGCCGS